MEFRFTMVREGLTALKNLTVRVTPGSKEMVWGISLMMTLDGMEAVEAFSDSGFENAQIDQVFGGAYIQELKLAIIDSPSDVDVPYILSMWERGSIQMEAYSLKDLTKVLSTDGSKWYLQEEDGDTELPVLEPRMAILYNCAARRYCKD